MGVGIAAAVGGLAMAGSAAYSASQSGKSGNAPGIETTMEKMYRARRQYQGGWQSLDAQDALYRAALQDRMAGNSLFGNAAQSYSLPYQTMSGNSGLFGTTKGQPVTKYRNFDIAASEGSLSMAARAQPYLQAMRRNDQMDQAGLTTDIYNQYGGQIAEANRNYDPQQTAMSDLLMQQATEGLNQGGRSTYEDRYLAQQIRGAQAARGGGFGNADLYQEAVGLDRNRQDRRLKQQDFASRVLGQRHAMYNPAQAQTLLFGRGGGATNEMGLVNNAMGASAQSPTSMVGAMSQGGALQQQAWAMNQSVQNQNANSLTSALGGLGNAAMSYAMNNSNPYGNYYGGGANGPGTGAGQWGMYGN